MIEIPKGNELTNIPIDVEKLLEEKKIDIKDLFPELNNLECVECRQKGTMTLIKMPSPLEPFISRKFLVCKQCERIHDFDGNPGFCKDNYEPAYFSFKRRKIYRKK